MTSKTGLARAAGALYLIVAVCGGFSELYVRSSVVVPGDPAATAAKVSASATLFRIGLATDLMNLTCFLLVAVTLYALLRQVGHEIALAMVLLTTVSVAIMGVNLLNHLGALLAATDPAFPAAFGAEDPAALVMVFLDLHQYGYLIAQVFFGLWLLPLGYLLVRSGYVPRVLGVLVMVASLGYLADLVAILLSPSFESSLSTFVLAPAVVGELSLILWLLVKGVRVSPQDQPVPAAA
jgi:Domain of unknown function (DUF4386)